MSEQQKPLLLFLIAIISFSGILIAEQTGEELVKARRVKFPVVEKAKNMTENLLLPQGGLTNPDVIDVMKRIPRQKFCLPVYQQFAYQDSALPIGNAQTISPPYIVAFMTEQLQPKPTDRVLEIGTGSGYQAAVLSLLVKEVYTIEIVEPLGKRAEQLLKKLGFDNVYTKVGDGYKGWEDAAPFDSIIVTCSPEKVPQPLVDQLREGGRMIIPLGERYQQYFYLCKKENGVLVKEHLTQTLFVPMTGQAEAERQVKPDPAKPQIIGGGFEEAREDGSPSGWHYARNVKIISAKDAPEGKSFIRFTSNNDAQILQGFAIDGKAIRKLTLSYSIRGKDIVPAQRRFQTNSAYLMFYDDDRNPISEGPIGMCSGSFSWQPVVQTISVPEKAKEAVLMIGLPAASGQLDADNVIITY
ncbi:MAG: protein-L-isoaspartate(D-aspartate) O-methyltransferase [Planctomycetaceae bacterium]|nr:protein-L-isoaspartate(D-aspartate) O-methyltransferase [Planctomycetaceae bacterium]